MGDDDGVLFIRPEIANELADATPAADEKEAGIMAHILSGETYDPPWAEEKRNGFLSVLLIHSELSIGPQKNPDAVNIRSCSSLAK